MTEICYSKFRTISSNTTISNSTLRIGGQWETFHRIEIYLALDRKGERRLTVPPSRDGLRFGNVALQDIILEFFPLCRFLSSFCANIKVLRITFRGDTMPLISHFYGILIRMFFNDQEQHHLPHFHAIYGEYSGSFSLDGEIITGNIPKKQLKLIAA